MVLSVNVAFEEDFVRYYKQVTIERQLQILTELKKITRMQVDDLP